MLSNIFWVKLEKYYNVISLSFLRKIWMLSTQRAQLSAQYSLLQNVYLQSFFPMNTLEKLVNERMKIPPAIQLIPRLQSDRLNIFNSRKSKVYTQRYKKSLKVFTRYKRIWKSLRQSSDPHWRHFRDIGRSHVIFVSAKKQIIKTKRKWIVWQFIDLYLEDNSSGSSKITFNTNSKEFLSYHWTDKLHYLSNNKKRSRTKVKDLPSRRNKTSRSSHRLLFSFSPIKVLQ